MPTKLSRVAAKLTIDYGLCARAERYATGEHVHTLANLLTPYLVIPKLDEACPESFRTAERNLRAFVTQITLTPECRLETLLMETALQAAALDPTPIPSVGERPRRST